jgi:predicted RNase H-like nuclease
MQPPDHPICARILGIDGCRAGWLVAQRQPSSAALAIQVMDQPTLEAALRECTLAFVDMPMGLSDCEPSRPCDRALRRILSKSRRSSVFNPPVRAVLGCETYDDANAASRLSCGAGLSRQSWFLVPRIRALDHMLAGQPTLQTRVLESHPEWLFERLAGHALAPKKTSLGFQQRLILLAAWAADVETIVAAFLSTVRRSAVQPDDVLDALVLLREAEMAMLEGLMTIPEGQSPGPERYHAAQ